MNKKIIILLYSTNILFLIITFSLVSETFLYLKYLASILIIMVIPGLIFLYLSKLLSEKNQIIELLISSLAISSSIYILIFQLTSTFNFKISPALVVATFYFIGLVFTKNKLFKFSTIISDNHLDNNIELFLLNILLFVLITPTKGLYVAPLHDPVANSVMSKYLITSDFSRLPKYSIFYPPGFSYISALLSSITNINSAKIVLISTNLFNALSAFSFALLFKIIYKTKESFYISLFSYVVLSSYVINLYFNAGKNSQIFSYFMLFSSLYFLVKFIVNYYSEKDSRNNTLIIAALTSVTSILIHYNSALILIFVLILFIIKKKDLIKKISRRKIFIIIFFLFILLTQVYRASQFKNIVATNDIHSSLFNTEKISKEILYKIISLKNLSQFFANLLDKNNYLYNTIFIISIGFLLRNYFINKRNNIGYLVAFVFYMYILINIPIKRISHFNHMNLFLINLIFLIMFLLILIKLISKKLLLCLIIISFGLSTIKIFEIYKKYTHARKFSVVTSSDIEAYQWINNHLNSNYNFMPATLACLYCGHNPYELDGSMYLKVFTNFEEYPTFEHGNKFYADYSREKNYFYEDIFQSTESISKETINKLKEYNIKYIYSGARKPWGEPDFDSNFFKNKDSLFKLIYQNNGGVAIYEIIN